MDKNRLDKIGCKLNGCCNDVTVLLYALLALPMLMPVFSFAAFNMVAPAIAPAVVGYGWLPSLIGAAGIFKLCAKMQQKNLFKKLHKIDGKIFKLEKERMSTDILSNYEILDSNVEALFLSTEDSFRVVKEKYKESKKETKSKIKKTKKRARFLKKYEILRQSQVKLDTKLKLVEKNNSDKEMLKLKSEKEREI